MSHSDLSLLLYSFDYPPNDGGIARLCGELARESSRNMDGVGVLTQTAARPGAPPRPQIDEMTVTARRPGREWASFRMLRRHRSAAVVSGIWYPEGVVAAMAGVKPHVILAHGSELMPPHSHWRREAWRMLQRWTLTSADLVVANSEYTRRLVLSGAPQSNVIAIPLGVDTHRFCPGDRQAAKRRFGVEGKTVVSTVARLHPYKGQELVLDALAALPERSRQSFVYLIAGKGPDRPRLEARAQRLGLTGAVRWLDFVPDTDLPDLYRATDLFVLCTRESIRDVEGFGLVFLEAQACATPVVGTRTGGIPDAVVDGEGGWLIEQDDTSALARILAQLAAHPENFRLAGQIARRRVERDCSWAQYWRRFSAAANACRTTESNASVLVQ
jgi:phosphatidylinositol alpha-1,6-mannosyltransferase